MADNEERVIWDKTKPMTELEMPAFAADAFEEIDVLELLADLLAYEEKVEYCFSLTGGSVLTIEPSWMKRGIKRVELGHEQAVGFAADAYGRLTRRPAVTLVSSGTGITNLSTGLLQAKAGQSPVVAIVAGQPNIWDDRWGAQGDLIAEPFLQHVTKWSRKVYNPQVLLHQVKRAFMSACDPPSGPVAIEIPGELTMFRGGKKMKAWLTMEYPPGAWPTTTMTSISQGSAANAATVESAIKWLLEAEKPAMIAGEWIWYHDAQEELREFAHLLGIPCHTRRMGRGAISEYDPLNARGRARGKIMRAADRTLVMGLRLGFLENYGMPPFFGTDSRFVQIQPSTELFCHTLPTEIWMTGNIKNVLRQMIDCARAMGIKGPVEKWAAWRQQPLETREATEQRTIERAEKFRGRMPFHPDLVGRMASEFLHDELNDEYITILGGFTATAFYTDWIKIKEAGRVLDAAETIGIGHPPAMAIGAALATDRKVPIITLCGDGDIHAGGMEIETASKWDIPALFIMMNNSTRATYLWEAFESNYQPTGEILKDSWQLLPKIRWDKIFAEFGCHGEYVTRDDEFKPALKRALDFIRTKSKPAFVNVITDPKVQNEAMAMGVPLYYGNIHWNDLPREGKELLTVHGMLNPLFLVYADQSWSKAYEEYGRTGIVPDEV